jgi:outer membrane protein
MLLLRLMSHPQKTLLAAAAFVCLFPQSGISAESGSKPRPQRIGLSDCIDVALQNNYGLAVKRIQAASALEDVESARAQFDPAFIGSAGRTEQAGLEGTRDVNLTSFRSGLTTRTITGATVDLTGNAVRGEEIVPVESPTGAISLTPVTVFDSDVELTIRQPLMKGAGVHVNRIPIEIGLIGVNEANLDVRRSVLDLVAGTESAYWQLLFAVREKEVHENTVTHAQRLLDETKARLQVGLATNVDTLQAEAALASRREAVIISQQSVEDKTDVLLVLLGKLGKKKYSIDLPEHFPPAQARPRFDDQELLNLVRELPEYAQQVQVIKSRQLLVDKARNDRLPSLDLTAGGGFVGNGKTAGSSLNEALRSGNANWQVLVEARVPFGFRAERAALAKSRYDLAIETLRIRDVEQQLLAQIREAARAVGAGNERVKTTDVSLRLNSEEYEQVFAKFKQGLNTFRETLLSQDDLDVARLASLSAQLDAVLAAIRLARLDGALLSRNHLGWSK